MQITIKFKDDDARSILYYLRRRYDKPRASLNKLARIAILVAVAEQAEKELETN